MAPYFVIFVLIALCSFADVLNIQLKQRKVIFGVLVLLLILFAGLRYGDHDYTPYQRIFKKSEGWNLEASDDVGYSLLNSIVGFFWNDPLAIFLVVAGLSISLNMSSFKSYGQFFLIAILFYFVHNYVLKEMIQIRAGLACAIGLVNLRNLQKGRYKYFWFWEIISLSLHLGAVMYIIAWLIKQFNFKPKTWWYLLAGCFIIGTIYPFGTLLKALPGMEMLERIQTYSEWGQYAESLGILTNMATLKQLTISVIMLMCYDRFKDHVKYYDIIAAMYFASTCWLMVWNDFAIVGARMATFLSIGEPIILSSFVLLVTPRSRPLMLTFLVLIALLFLLTNMQGDKILPYQFYPLVP